MFVRAKKRGNRTYLMIVKNERVNGKVKQTVLHSLGRLDLLRESGELDALLISAQRFSEQCAVLDAHDNGESIGFLLVVKDPVAFAAEYSPPPAVVVLGPYAGQLSNGGEKLELAMPGDVNGSGIRQHIRVDRVNYDDAAPWPTGPDGGGTSLKRKVTANYGNDVANWQAASPTPGL